MTRFEDFYHYLHRHGVSSAQTSNSSVSLFKFSTVRISHASFFVHLVKSLGPEDYLAPISMLLVDRSTTKAGRGGNTASQAMELPHGVAAAFDVDTRLEVSDISHCFCADVLNLQVVLDVVAEVSRLVSDTFKSDNEVKEAFLHIPYVFSWP